MRIFEVITDEAISITPHKKSFEDAIKKGIANGFSELGTIKGQYPEEEKEFEEGHSKRFRAVVTEFLEKKVAVAICESLLSASAQALGRNIVTSISFKKIKEAWGGYASGTDIVISRDLLNKLLNVTLENLFNTTYDSYGDGEYADGLYFGAKAFASGDRHVTYVILDYTNTQIRDIISVLVHELVHVMQHKAQYNKGRTDTEYRSYLDKKKGEFYSKHQATSKAAEDDRYYDLYYSSPQEISAFAHQAALSVIQNYYMDDVDNVEDLRSYTSELNPRDIMSAIEERIGERFKKPRNPKELTVYKRYVKLVYLEVQRYIENQVRVLSKSGD